MAVTVMIPTALRAYTETQDAIQLEGATVGEVLGKLTVRFPKLKPHLFSNDGELRNFVNVFVNETNIRDAKQTATPLADGDEVAIVPAVAGGGFVG